MGFRPLIVAKAIFYLKLDLRLNQNRGQQPFRGGEPTWQPVWSWRSGVCTVLCAVATVVKQEVARNLWFLKTCPHLDARLWPQVWVEYPCSRRPRAWGNRGELCLHADLSPLPPSQPILSCGQPVATGSAWMDSLRRPHRPREPGRRPIPTLGTAPSLPQQARNQAARLVAPTSPTRPGR